MLSVDLDNTDHCIPTGVCDGCGERERPVRLLPRQRPADPVEPFRVYTVENHVGVWCIWLCAGCRAWSLARQAEPDPAAKPWPAPISVGAAVRRVLLHCAHLGITDDEMAAALSDEAAAEGIAS